jgi:hypothetical protein
MHSIVGQVSASSPRFRSIMEEGEKKADKVAPRKARPSSSEGGGGRLVQAGSGDSFASAGSHSQGTLDNCDFGAMFEIKLGTPHGTPEGGASHKKALQGAFDDCAAGGLGGVARGGVLEGARGGALGGGRGQDEEWKHVAQEERLPSTPQERASILAAACEAANGWE